MKLVNEQLLKKFDSFVKTISDKDKIGIYHDSDPDGTCSAVIVAKAIEQLTGKKISIHIGRIKNERYFSADIADKFRAERITKIISVDIAADQKPEGLALAQAFADVLIIDHHKLYCEEEIAKLKRVILMKPQLLYSDVDPTLYCAAKFSYDLFSRHTNLDALDWVATVGIIGDVGGKMWQDFVINVFKKQKLKITKDLFKSKLGKVAHVISSAEVYDDKNIPLCFDVLYSAQKPDDVIDSVLTKFKNAIEKEINYFAKNARKLAERYEDAELIFYLIKPKYAVKSPLSTILGFKYPNKTLIVACEEEGKMTISARRQDKKIAVNNLLEEAVKGFENSNAGGHAVAAGAAFPPQYFELFKKRIIDKLREVSSKKYACVT